MASESTTILNTDIYKVSQFVDSIKARYVDIPEDTLVLGVYGYLSSVISNALENTAIMASEYSNEAIPTKAKFERNIISHALSLGINKIFAVPSYIDITLNLPESKLLENLIEDPDVVNSASYTGGAPKDTFIVDKDCVFRIGQDEEYEYHLDYDIKIKRSTLANGTYVYNAMYMTDSWHNEMVTLNNPYLPAIGLVNVEGDNMLSIKTTIRQYTHTEIYSKIIIENPLENKILNFTWEDQLIFFYIEVDESNDSGGTDKHILVPVYDGLYNNTTASQEYVNFLFLDDKNIRVKFNRDVYQPRKNSDVTIHVITCLGDETNFMLSPTYYKVGPLNSSRFNYASMYYMITPVGDSIDGQNKLSIEQLKLIIPQEAISRGSIATYTDLNNAFNSVQTPDIKMTFLRKVHNQVERLYYAYLLLRDSNKNIIPTNTVTSYLERDAFDSITKYSFILKPGALFYLDLKDNKVKVLAQGDYSQSNIDNMDNTSFLYTCPYLMVMNKSPFYVSYYMTMIHYTRDLYFRYINDKSLLQFITLSYSFHRDMYPSEDDTDITDPNYLANDNSTYHIEMTLVQNIPTDYDIIKYDDDGAIEECRLSVYIVFYQKDSEGEEYPFKYVQGVLTKFDESDSSYNFEFRFKTSDRFAKLGSYIEIIKGLKNIGTGVEVSNYMPPNIGAKFFVFAKFDQEFGRTYEFNHDGNIQDCDGLIPNLTGYTLTNIYDAGEQGIDIFYDYSDLNNSYCELGKNPVSKDNNFIIYKVPVIRYTYMNTEAKWRSIMRMIDRRRKYIQNVLLLLEDSFGIDYKFYNTYGKSLTYNIEKEEQIDRINLKLKFEIKFVSESENVILSNITTSIKEYIEDMNNVSDLHMPNLITYITNLYRDHIVYIKFIGLNDYGSLYQSVYKNPILSDNYFIETQTVPEFINVNTNRYELPDIEYKVVS